MSLQYRTRDMSEDRRWERRLRLLGIFLLDVVDEWCLDDHEFPCDFVLSSTLYLFSPRCDPISTKESGLSSFLEEAAKPPETECALAHPEKSLDLHLVLIQSLRELITQQAKKWELGDTISPSTIGALAKMIVDQVIQHKYVKFHRTQTTSRDHGGFHGLW